MEFSSYDILRFITVFQFLFLALILLTIKKGNKLSNRLFSVFLFSKALCFADGILNRYKEVIIQWTPHVFLFGLSFEFLIGPALFLYIISLTDRDFKLKKSHFFHSIPFLIHLIIMAIHFHLLNYDMKMKLLNGYLFTYQEYIINYLVIYIHFIVYSVLALITIARYRKKIKAFFSTVDNIKLSWATIIVWIFIALWGISMIFFILRIFGFRIFLPGEVSILLLFIFANLLIYKGLTQPVIFSGKLFNDNNKHYSLSEETANNHLRRLLDFMENEKPYLDNNLTLSDLAGKVSMSTRHLSHVINNKLKQNFYDFVNRYRVKEAKQLLIDPDFQKYTILGVAFEAGFNSKSTFNLIFKKFEKVTPSQFQKSHLH